MNMAAPLTLISHLLCPYVQRAAIVLAEKNVPFERRDVNLANKPDWFVRLSPLGKTPVLLVDEEVIFESAVICEYLDETHEPRLHPTEPLQRARHRAWMEFGSQLLNAIWAFYTAADEPALQAKANEIRMHLGRLEAAHGGGLWFDGEFSLVDAVFGPVFRYFDVFDDIADFGFWNERPRLLAWRAALAERPSVQTAVRADYPELLRRFLIERNSALSRRMTAMA